MLIIQEYLERKKNLTQVWENKKTKTKTSVLWRQRQEGLCEFEASLIYIELQDSQGYIERHCLENKQSSLGKCVHFYKPHFHVPFWRCVLGTQQAQVRGLPLLLHMARKQQSAQPSVC